jgi:hypothetical protein
MNAQKVRKVKNVLCATFVGYALFGATLPP